MKNFSSKHLADINAQISTGRFIEAVVFVRDKSNHANRDYFIKNSRAVSFNGNVYKPLDMIWSGVKISTAMELPSTDVTVSNLGGIVLDYIEDKSITIDGNDVWLQILHIDKLGVVSLVEEMRFQLEFIVADYHTSATFHLGVNLSLNDPIPRHTLEKQEFPGIKDDVIRVGT